MLSLGVLRCCCDRANYKLMRVVYWMNFSSSISIYFYSIILLKRVVLLLNIATRLSLYRCSLYKRSLPSRTCCYC